MIPKNDYFLSSINYIKYSSLDINKTKKEMNKHRIGKEAPPNDKQVATSSITVQEDRS